ncbi:MAG: multidrug efflux SMR transporter [Pseudomonadota bacterium]
MHWIHLGIAIVAEVAGSSALKASNGFTRIGPTILAIAAFVVALFFLSLTLRALPLGTALIAALGVFAFQQNLDLAAGFGIALIVAGVVVINTLSNTTTH